MLLILGALLLQVDPDAVRRLGDPDAAVREQATLTLKQLPFDRVAELRKLSQGETDPERRERLRLVVLHLLRKESDALYEDGRLEESLLNLVESEGEADPAETLGRRVGAARDSLAKIWAGDEGPGSKILFPDWQLREVRSHGRYALRPLIDGLTGPHAFSAAHLLIHCVGDPLPALWGLVRREDGPRAQAVCHVLGRLGDARAIAMLRSIRRDPARSAALRDCALSVLQSSREYPESCEPEVIARLVCELGSDDAGDRERATAALKEHPPGIATLLRELTKIAIDAEQRERLGIVVRHLVGRKAEELCQDGKLDEALLYLAESEGAADPAADVELRIQEAGRFLVSQFSLEGYSVEQLRNQPSARDQVRKDGYFGVAALLRMLDGEYAGKSYLMLTRFPGDLDVVPALCGDLRKPEQERSYKVCHALGRIGGEKAVRMLTSIKDDPDRSERLRRCARNGLMDLGILPKD